MDLFGNIIEIDQSDIDSNVFVLNFGNYDIYQYMYGRLTRYDEITDPSDPKPKYLNGIVESGYAMRSENYGIDLSPREGDFPHRFGVRFYYNNVRRTAVVKTKERIDEIFKQWYNESLEKEIKHLQSRILR
jgi:hypothetical protein